MLAHLILLSQVGGDESLVLEAAVLQVLPVESLVRMHVVFSPCCCLLFQLECFVEWVVPDLVWRVLNIRVVVEAIVRPQHATLQQQWFEIKQPLWASLC